MLPNLSSSQKNLEQLEEILNKLVLSPILEFYYSYKYKTFPFTRILIFTLMVLLFTFMGFDYWIFKKLKIWKLYPIGNFYKFYVLILASSGVIGWAIRQVQLKIKLTDRLTTIFTDAGLKSASGKLPDFVFDRPIDEHVRVLRIVRNGLPLKNFQNSLPYLESGMQIFVDEIKEDRTKGTIDIVYSHQELSTTLEYNEVSAVEADTFYVGKSRGPVIEANLNEIPHLLIAGQTGGGKSTFLRQFIVSLYLKNLDYDFFLIDLKGGLEFQIFDKLPRITVVSSIESAALKLENVASSEIEWRKEQLKKFECKDILSYQEKIRTQNQKNDKGGPVEGKKLRRLIFVIDEAFEIFMAGLMAKPKEAQEAKRNASKIAAQGRAVGVHLVIATQRPDRFAVDPQTKANLPGILTFPLPNQASSRTVLDNARACDLPAIKGRGLWKSGGKIIEVQTPNLPGDEAQKLLEPFRISSNKNDKENSDLSDQSNLLKNL